MVRQRSAKPLFPSSNLGAASKSLLIAEVAELADARDLKSLGPKRPYRFDSGLRHQNLKTSVAGFFIRRPESEPMLRTKVANCILYKRDEGQKAQLPDILSFIYY